ncbi:MAG: DUF3105 domain-containing protein [Acidimicrobiia bacterium]|nr:DUF3105 domain-containing protein [Acidimicrobiia bacterium]
MAPVRSWRPGAGSYIALAIVAGIAALLIFSPDTPGQAYEDLGNFHLEDPNQPHDPYNSAPPSSGPHLGVLARWGVHDDVIPPELFVHNLEDGGIVFAYDCSEPCPDIVDGLTSLVEGLGDGVMLTAYPGIIDSDGVAHRAAAVAWTRVLYFDGLDAETLDEVDVFVDLYRGVDHHRGG